MAAALSQPSMVKAPSALTMQEIRQNQVSLRSRIDGAVYSSDDENIPLIDIGPSYGGDETARRAVAAQIGAACREIGFFQITNHGVSLQARNGVMAQAERFFHRYPQAKKEAMHLNHSKLFRGWEPSGVTNINPEDWKDSGKETKEAFNWGYEPALDPTGGDGKYVEMDLEPSPPEGANVWPSEEDLPGFFEVIKHYHGEVCVATTFMSPRPVEYSPVDTSQGSLARPPPSEAVRAVHGPT